MTLTSAKTLQRPKFNTIEERDNWFLENAEYFTVVRRRGLQGERHETKTLQEAEQLAKRILTEEPDPHARFMIYAINGIGDTYVKTVHK